LFIEMPDSASPNGANENSPQLKLQAILEYPYGTGRIPEVLANFNPCPGTGFWKALAMVEALTNPASQLAPTRFHAIKCDRLAPIGIRPHQLWLVSGHKNLPNMEIGHSL
jgi:hypothetical protein